MSSLLLFISVIVISGTHELQLPSGGGWQQRIEIVPDSTQFDIHLPWLVQGSLSVLSNDDSLQSGVDFTWSDSTQTVTFFPVHLISPGDTLLIRYRSAAVIDRLEFQYYTPSVITDMDSSASISDSGIVRRKTERFDPLGAWGGLHRRGTLTRGVRFGETNDNVVSGLHLELSGRPVPGVTVDAVLDDRDIPAAGGGGSATLSELDRILFKVSTPHLIAELGDWDLNWEQGRYGRLNRQLKGGRLQANYSPIQAEIAAAGDDNTYHSIMLSGRTGDQGPYELTDRFGRPGVVVATGSERIYLNGIQLKRGREADYTIDYQRGAITFTPNVVIRSDSRIEAEYEYNDGNYPRYLYAGRLTKIYRGMTNHTRSGVINTAATNLAIDASAVIEGSNGDSPLAFEWNDIWQNAISSAGDDLLGAVVSGVDSVDSGNGDYVWSYIDGERVLEFSQPDSLGCPTGYLQVNFSTDPTGDYKRFYDFSFQTFYYQWIGSGLGDWSPVQHLPLPDQLKHVDLITRFNIGRFDIEGEAAVSDYDRNTFSSLDDDDNVGMAWNGRLLWGRQDYDVLFASFSVRNRECHYTSLERNVEPDYRYKWNLSDSVQGAETAIETDVHFNPISQVVFSGNAGWLEQGNDNTSQRLGLRSLWKGKRLQAEAGFDQAKNDSRSRSNDSKRTHWDGRIKRSIGAFRPVYSFQAEWERDRADTSSINGSRFILHEISLEKYFSYTRESRNPRVGIMKADGLDSRFRGNDKVGLTFNYRSEDKLGSERDIHWSDTRSLQANWQSRRPRTGGWSMDFQRTYTTYTDRAHSSITATSAALEALYNPYTSPWSIWIIQRF